jgi:hypothetical protein
MAEEDLTAEELEELEKLGLGYPRPGDKGNLFEFFNKILKTKDTTKVANLDKDELFAVRALQDAALFSNVFELDLVNEYLKNKGEIVLASSDSKGGFLITTAVTQKRHIDSGNKFKSTGGGLGWFKKKEQPESAG